MRLSWHTQTRQGALSRHKKLTRHSNIMICNNAVGRPEEDINETKATSAMLMDGAVKGNAVNEICFLGFSFTTTNYYNQVMENLSSDNI